MAHLFIAVDASVHVAGLIIAQDLECFRGITRKETLGIGERARSDETN